MHHQFNVYLNAIKIDIRGRLFKASLAQRDSRIHDEIYFYILLFSNKRSQHICNIYGQNIDETLTNDVVNFEQLAPGR